MRERKAGDHFCWKGGTQLFQDLAKGAKDSVHSTTLCPDVIMSQPLPIAKANLAIIIGTFPQFLQFLHVKH